MKSNTARSKTTTPGAGWFILPFPTSCQLDDGLVKPDGSSPFQSELTRNMCVYNRAIPPSKVFIGFHDQAHDAVNESSPIVRLVVHIALKKYRLGCSIESLRDSRILARSPNDSRSWIFSSISIGDFWIHREVVKTA